MLFSKWFPMAYHYIFQFQFGTVGERSGMSIKQSKIHLCEIALMFPQGVLIRFMQGKQCQVEGKIAKAIGEKRCRLYNHSNISFESNFVKINFY